MKDLSPKYDRSKSRFAACFVVILLAAALAVLLTSCGFFSSDVVIKKLDITATLREDGTVDFYETSKVKFSKEETTWWNFYREINDETLLKRVQEDKTAFVIDGSSFKVNGKSVRFVEEPLDLEVDGAKAKYTKLYKDEAVGYFYMRSSGVEIGVILPEFSKGTYTISYGYSVKGIVTGIADNAEFYYKFLAENSSMDVEKMTVTVNFAKEEPDLRCWLHNSASAVGVWKQSDDKKSVKMIVEDISAGEYVETRMLLNKTYYTLFETDNTRTSVDVENQEKAWYEAYQTKQRILLAITILDYLLGALAIGLGVFVLFYLKRKNRPLDLPDAPIYYRDIPEGYTGGEVSPLYFYYSNENYIDESISASMLELVRLGYLSILPDEKKKGAVITVLKKDEEDALRTHQKLVVEMLSAVKPMGTPFTMKEFETYGKEHPGKMMSLVEKYKAAIRNKSERDGAYRKTNPVRTAAQKFATAMVGVGIAIVAISGFTSFILGVGTFFFGAGMLIGGLIPYLFSKKVKAPLTVAGQKEYDKLHALAKFMQEFSMMDEHDIPELVLWEDYMIFAAAMGIADKVAKQLEIAYPEFKNMSVSGNFDASGLLILYFFSPSFRLLTGLNFVGNVANVIRSVQIADRALKAAKLAGKVGGIVGGGSGRGGGGSSFHGGGGGFSGGGFGGRR